MCFDGIENDKMHEDFKNILEIYVYVVCHDDSLSIIILKYCILKKITVKLSSMTDVQYMYSVLLLYTIIT